MRHELKTWPHEFDAVKAGTKTFDVRSNADRDFAVGDELVLRKWDPATVDPVCLSPGAYIGPNGFPLHRSEGAATIYVRVTYVLHGGRFGLPPGLCVMSIVRDPEVRI